MGCMTSRPRPPLDPQLSGRRPHAGSQGSQGALNAAAAHISEALTNFAPVSFFTKRLAVVTEEEDAYGSFSNQSRGCFPRLQGSDPTKVLVYLDDADLARAAQINCAFRDAVRTFDAIKYAKLESRPHLQLHQWYHLGVASRGGGQTWARLRRRLGKEPAMLTCPVEVVSDLDEQLFAEKYEAASQPVLIKGAATDWEGASDWTLDSLEHRYGDQLFRFNDLHGEEIRLSDFVRYARTTDDDFPLGLYDSQFGVREEDPRRMMLSEYSPPACFGKDLFELAPKDSNRPPYRWLLVGLPRGGTEMHVDPLGTSAWVTLVQGRKRWALFPPGKDSKEIGGCNSTEEIHARVPTAVEWFAKYHNTPATSDAVEVLQQAGDTVFVPGGWKHIVINLDETVAVTHNYAPLCNLDAIRAAVRQAEPEFAKAWEAALAKHRV